MDTDDLRTPPHSLHAEQSVIGGLLLDNNAWERVAEIVGESDFYRHEHRVIFNAITALADTLTRKGRLEAVGGKAYLITLIRDTPSTANIHVYAGIVRKHSMLRQMITTGTAIIDNAYSPKGRDVSELLDDAEHNIFAIAEREARVGGGFQPIRVLLQEAVDEIDALFQSDNHITGLPTGFKELDTLTSGLQPADLIIVAGRPSMGKTALAMNIAEYVAMTSKRSVAIFSMEMPSKSLTKRMLSSLGRIDQQKVRTGQLNDAEWSLVTAAMARLSTAELFIDDTPALSPLELRTRARRLKREWNDLGLIVIDYLQLMQASTHEN
ncbi:replicative DNA helicase, partial [Chromatium okenii]|uniref:replicative DNA helicase n=1 Tax=Chromatium okenii TaxID=61644 RepID=UPI0026E9CAC0